MLHVNHGKNYLIADHARDILNDRYLYFKADGEKENPQDMFARLAKYYGDHSTDHPQRMYNYMSDLWFIPSTPVLSNGGTDRGLPISCFLNECEDTLRSITDMWIENVFLASRGGGIGSYWGNLRSLGEKVHGNGKTSGIIPFIKVQDSLTTAISQGSLRRGSTAVYLPIDHPEIEEFISIRKPMGGDPERKCLQIHHGVCISDAFMKAVETDDNWNLISPRDKSVVKQVKARTLWISLLTTRLETGEPYMIFIDTVNRNRPDIYKKLNLDVKMSNLCTEITLATGKDYNDKERTGVCCLGSLNLAKSSEWKGNSQFIEDVLLFLDNVLSDFIKKAPKEMANAVYSATQERSVGLGVMGFHTLLQQCGIPFDSPMAKDFNLKFFKWLKKECDQTSKNIAKNKGSCPDAVKAGIEHERFVHKISIAPTASISIIGGNVSPGIDPFVANIYSHRTLSGTHIIKNKVLQKLLKAKNKDTDLVWQQILNDNGSVKNLSFLSEIEKDTFKTAYEVNPWAIIEHAADRTPFVCQAQSVNLFLPANINKKDLNKLYFHAWKKGLKSLYYQRSQSIQRGDSIGDAPVGCLACE